VPVSDKTITVSFDPPTEENWDSYMAAPTTEAALHVVRALAIVPTVGGGVQFELHINGHEIEIEFDAYGLLESAWVGTTAKSRTHRTLGEDPDASTREG
jgi:hypothetical protein